MSDGIGILDIVLVAMVAGFIFLRLRGLLGRRTGHERQRTDPYRLQEGGEDGLATPSERERQAERDKSREAEAALWAEDSPFGAGLTQIKIADHGFEPGGFLEGGRAAYDMIVTAFARGDRATLRGLLSDEVYENFETAITERESQHQRLETTITQIKSADIVDARMNRATAEITVKFVSDMVSVLRDDKGENVGGAPQEREVTDIWTFARDTGKRDPNWLLIATSSEN